MIESEEQLRGEKIEPGARFCFACHAGLSCFNTCCANKRLPVLPYDLLRLRRGLGLSSVEVLERYIELESDPVSGWPVLRLRLDGQGRCPFVQKQGCGVYAHRPAACRIYPLSRAVAPARDGRPAREMYLRLDTPGCLGWAEPRQVSLAEWVGDQELLPYHRANDQVMELFLHPGRKGRMELNQRQTHGVILALYNLEVFRQLAGQAGFAGRFGLDEALCAAAMGDDEALLRLGQAWLARQLFGG